MLKYSLSVSVREKDSGDRLLSLPGWMGSSSDSSDSSSSLQVELPHSASERIIPKYFLSTLVRELLAGNLNFTSASISPSSKSFDSLPSDKTLVLSARSMMARRK